MTERIPDYATNFPAPAALPSSTRRVLSVTSTSTQLELTRAMCARRGGTVSPGIFMTMAPALTGDAQPLHRHIRPRLTSTTCNITVSASRTATMLFAPVGQPVVELVRR